MLKGSEGGTREEGMKEDWVIRDGMNNWQYNQLINERRGIWKVERIDKK